MLAPICKREKSDQRPLSARGVPVCSRWGCRQTFHEAFLPWLDSSLSLTNAGAVFVPLGLPLMWGGDAPEVDLDLMASQTDV